MNWKSSGDAKVSQSCHEHDNLDYRIGDRGNGKMDYNETGLANWTINLEQPVGNVISKAVTDSTGGYGFSGFAPGEYAVVEVSETGWSLTAPPNGKYVVNLTKMKTC